MLANGHPDKGTGQRDNAHQLGSGRYGQLANSMSGGIGGHMPGHNRNHQSSSYAGRVQAGQAASAAY